MRVAQSARGDAGALRLADQRAVEIQAREYRIPSRFHTFKPDEVELIMGTFKPRLGRSAGRPVDSGKVSMGRRRIAAPLPRP